MQKRSYARARIIMAVFSLILTAVLAFAAVNVAQQVLDEVDDTLLNNVGVLAETLITGEITQETEALLGEWIENEINMEIDLTEAEREQLSDLISAYLTGEITLPPEFSIPPAN